jgi:hypothetical protein
MPEQTQSQLQDMTVDELADRFFRSGAQGHHDEEKRYYASDCGQWKRYICIGFNFTQRLRILFGQRVFVYFHDGTPPAHVSYVAPKNWNPDLYGK